MDGDKIRLTKSRIFCKLIVQQEIRHEEKKTAD